MADSSSLSGFSPHVRQWFASRLGRPTAIQRKAWPLIAGNGHLLVMSPTGSGKTLAAFLWAVDQLIRGRWQTGATRVLYVSPLKALNNDVRRNLVRPLAELRRRFEAAGDPFPDIRVATRSGDTQSHERRQMMRRPPEILITTPESLHLLLSSHGGRDLLGRIRTVILDEIHALLGNKRGTLLMTAVERLVDRCGEFQRIALSATIRPAAVAGAFVAGFTHGGDPSDPAFTPRPIAFCRVERPHRLVTRVRIPQSLLDGDSTRGLWEELADDIRRTIAAHRATIIFTNSRRLCEKLTFLINGDRSPPVAYAHHGSLSRELRLEVEQMLKRGDLRAIVATASLELGIDIGTLDQVILVQSPPSIASAVQRIGRSGHGVNEVRRADFVATHAVDAIGAAVLAEAVEEAAIEAVHPVDNPLDVLAQVLVSMAGVETWAVDALYHAVRRAFPFRNLTRRAFDLVLEMLAGRYADTRIAALRPTLAIDRIEHTLAARKGALLALYSSGGVIPDRGYYPLRHRDSGARIGELDEEFVWEARPGQVFTLGTQNWRIRRITDNEVWVTSARSSASAPPFWRAENADRNFFLSDRIARFLEQADQRLDDSGFVEELCRRCHLDQAGARYLVDVLKRQRRRTGCALPHRHHVVVETMPVVPGAPDGCQTVIHTFWGGRVNRPYALALAAAWEKRHGGAPSIYPTDDALYLMLSDAAAPETILSLVTSTTVDALLHERLEGSGVFGARFRECAARALLLPRRRFNQRQPLWLSRQQARRLMEAVGRLTDFPILMEAWRSCLQDDFDLPALHRLLRELEQGRIAWSVVKTASPSPMARSGSWRPINQYMYADDRAPGRMKTDLSRDLLQAVLFTPELRPAVDATIVDEFLNKRQRLDPGYAPVDAVEVLEWVKERLVIPGEEWRQLLAHAEADSETPVATLLAPIREKLLRLIADGGDDTDRQPIVAREAAPRIAAALFSGRTDVRWVDLDGHPVTIDRRRRRPGAHDETAAAAVLEQWLRFYGPLDPADIQRRLAIQRHRLTTILSELIANRTLISGRLIDGQPASLVCHADNVEALLRMTRRAATRSLEPLAIDHLAPLLARYQGLAACDPPVDMADWLQPLTCLPLPGTLWETEILPARLANYDPQWMDRLMHASTLMWVGRPDRRIAFCWEEDLDLMIDGRGPSDGDACGADPAAVEAVALFPERRGRYRLSDLLGDPPQSARQVLSRLWAGVWAGLVTNDSMMALRRGLAQDPGPIGEPDRRPVAGRSGMRRRRIRADASGAVAAGAVGNWRLIAHPAPPDGEVAAEEAVKDRVRLLMARYGILFRQLLDRELPSFRWSSVFRALRLMELSGEIHAGCFFEGLPGPQFVSPAMLQLVGAPPGDDRLFWLSALDPASLCGLPIDGLTGTLPRRSAGTHLVYLGRRLALVSRQTGKILHLHLPVDHPRLSDCFVLFDHLLGRRIDPVKAITIETIDGRPATESPVLDLLCKRFDTVGETRAITLYRRLDP